jgi:hypothetical protein
MKEFHASSILEVIEKEDEATKIENRFQTDIQKFLKAKPQQLFCTQLAQSRNTMALNGTLGQSEARCWPL